MNVSVVIPWRDGCPHREAALKWVLAKFAWHHPDWQVVLGSSPDGPFNRSAAILDGARKCDGDVIVVADGDVWCDSTEAVDQAVTHGWSRPHRLIHRLSHESTALVLGGYDWRDLPLSTDNSQDRRPYRGNDTGTLVVLIRDLLFDIPPDMRFVGWGQEDQAWGRALRHLHGAAWCGDADLVHLWHPPQRRDSRVEGNRANVTLWRKYERARSQTVMRALVDASKVVDPWHSSRSS